MESITIKVEDNLAREMEKAMKEGYATKTEFIREAIRDKVNAIKYPYANPKLLKHLGRGAHLKITDEDVRRIREELSK
jgi:metal-responsive CopG/Arc/MetJ family transcriptional regulator